MALMDFMTSDFNLAGLGSVGATLFTNPIEVIKTRLQLQGELAKRGTYVEPYKGILNCFVTVGKNEGIKGLQKGLVPALYFQFFFNSCRLSMFTKSIEYGWAQDRHGKISFWKGMWWGGLGGIIGGWISSPFFRVKTQLQAQAPEAIAVGFQHSHTGMISAFKNIYQAGGIPGLWIGATAAIPRSFIGSGAQIATFGWTKSKLVQYDIVTQPTLCSFVASLLAGWIMSLAITPPDVVTTRLYNQQIDEHGRGALYNGYLDCVVKIWRTEGLYGLYKGFWANYMRLAPHTTLVLLFFDELLALRDRMMKKKN